MTPNRAAQTTDNGHFPLERALLHHGCHPGPTPQKAPKLFAYQALIIRIYRGHHWVFYDRAFRREALAARNLDWSNPNQRLNQEAFTGRTKDIPRCSFWLEDDHTSDLCPRNPSPVFFNHMLYPPSLNWSGTTPNPNPPARRPSNEVCIKFNKGTCRNTDSKCKYVRGPTRPSTVHGRARTLVAVAAQSIPLHTLPAPTVINYL